ncbi:MAG TPA: molybdopterin-dependent oxidoreductase [Acidimicrobiales bacterium]|nr:molybdopterin-dependent oxidoreductase [Acidimicrobiales bacterium]
MIELRTTCPRDCYDACGIVVSLLPGERPRVRGDREHPVSRGQLCRKCSLAYNGVFLDPAARITTPLRRAGPKGAGQFVPVSWDDALGEISDRLGRILATDGPAAVLNTHYTGTFAMIGYHFPSRFFNYIGATEVDPDTICNKAGHSALEYLYGTSLDGFDPRAIADAASVLVWGANPSASAPHQHENWLGEAPCPTIVVDPLRTGSAKAADIHLQPYPGVDSALAFGLLHVLERDGRLDPGFIASSTVGFETLLPQIRACSPAWTESVTGVPSSLITQAAHVYGAGPSLLWIGQGLQRQPAGGNVVRAVGLLPALTGHLGRPGGGFLYLNGIQTRGLDGDYLAATHLRKAGGPAISHMDLIDALEGSARALFCWNINIAASNPRQGGLHQALRREDLFTVVADLFPTDTVDYADVVLPAASFLEQDDLVVSYFHHSLSAQVKVVEPPGQALPNSEIFRRLAVAMGLDQPELHEPDEEIIDRLLAQSGTGLDFAALASLGTVWPAVAPRIQFADRTFATPSGRIELASPSAAAEGHQLVPTPRADPPPPEGRLRLLSPSSEWNLNTTYGNDDRVGRQAGVLAVTVHPEEATRRGLNNGDRARVHNDVGELLLPVAVSEDVPPRVALIPKGRWPKREAAGGNVNALNPGRRSDLGNSSAVHGTEVWVTAAPEV